MNMQCIDDALNCWNCWNVGEGHIQVPKTNMVWVICGIAPYKGDLFSGQPIFNVEGKLLELLHKPAIGGETPTVVEQPEELLHLHEVTLPTEKEFTAKLTVYLENNKDEDGTLWFKESNVTAKFKLPSAMPCPAYLAYDAFMDDISAPILWERIKVEEAMWQCTELFHGSKAFLIAANTKHNKGHGTVAIPNTFVHTKSKPRCANMGKSSTGNAIPQHKGGYSASNSAANRGEHSAEHTGPKRCIVANKCDCGARPRDRMCEKVWNVHHESQSYLKTVLLDSWTGRAPTTMDQRDGSKATNQGQEA